MASYYGGTTIRDGLYDPQYGPADAHECQRMRAGSTSRACKVSQRSLPAAYLAPSR